MAPWRGTGPTRSEIDLLRRAARLADTNTGAELCFVESGASIAMALRCDSSSIVVVGPIDPEFRQLAADTIGATKHGNDKPDLRFSDWHISAISEVTFGGPAWLRSWPSMWRSPVTVSSTLPMSAPDQIIESGIVHARR